MLLAGTALASMLLGVACTADAGADAPPADGAPGTAPLGSGEAIAGRTAAETPAGANVAPLVVNVTLSDDAILPEVLAIPLGRPITLIVRNRGTREHHYQIRDMAATGLFWFAGGDGAVDPVLAAEDPEAATHGGHHGPNEMLPYDICDSKYGFIACPTGEWVHVYAPPSGMDVIAFSAAQTGTYDAFSQFDPGLTAKVVVY